VQRNRVGIVRYYYALVVQGIPDASSGDYYNGIVTFSCSSVPRVLSPMAKAITAAQFRISTRRFDGIPMTVALFAIEELQNWQRAEFRPPAPDYALIHKSR
jgi:hypothetical protein